MTLKDLFEASLDDREVALFTAWLLVKAKSPDEVKSRLFAGYEEQVSVVAKGFKILVEQYLYFMQPLYGGKPPFVLFWQTDEAFSGRKGWLSMSSQGFSFAPPPD